MTSLQTLLSLKSIQKLLVKKLKVSFSRLHHCAAPHVPPLHLRAVSQWKCYHSKWGVLPRRGTKTGVWRGELHWHVACDGVELLRSVRKASW